MTPGPVATGVVPKNLTKSEEAAWTNGSKLQITGICTPKLDAQAAVDRTSGSEERTSFQILMGSPNDVVVLELECDVPFEDFLAKELVPWARENYEATSQPARTIVAGSSLGGLAAVFAGLEHPEVFGKVISLSGSFWWKPAGNTDAEWLTNLVRKSPKLPLQFYLEVGLMESQSMQIDTNRRMRDALIAKGYPVGYFEYDGGHSFLTWSGGMANGLETLLGPSGAGRELERGSAGNENGARGD